MADGELDGRGDSDLLEKDRDEIKKPEMFRVLLHNDHYTTMEFVIEVLRVVFHKYFLEATKIMLDVHRKGVGIVGAYTYDVAQTRAARVLQMAREREFPLQCTVEQA